MASSKASPFMQPLNRRDFLAIKNLKPPPPAVASSSSSTSATALSTTALGNPYGSSMGETASKWMASSRASTSPPSLSDNVPNGSRHEPIKSYSDHVSSRTALCAEEMLASLPQAPYNVPSSCQASNAVSSPMNGSNDSQNRHGSGILRERDLDAMEQQQRQSNEKPKVRFEHLHHSCPIIDEGATPYSSSRKTATESDANGDVAFARFHISPSASSKSVKAPPSLPRTTLDADIDLTYFDLTEVSRRGVCLGDLPLTSGLQQTLLLRRDYSKDTNAYLTVESMRVDKLATITSATTHSNTQEETQERIIKDMDGNMYAVILPSIVDGQHRFKVCGFEAMFPEQRKSRDSGYFTYADVKNSSGMIVKFSMKLRGDSGTKYVTEAFGPSIFQWGSGRSKNTRGFAIKATSDGNTSSEEVARITFLGAGKALSVAPHQDFRLIIAFAAIIDEMVEKRLR